MLIAIGVSVFLKDDIYMDTSAFNSATLGSRTPPPLHIFNASLQEAETWLQWSSFAEA